LRRRAADQSRADSEVAIRAGPPPAGDDIGGQRVFELRQSVAQEQFALLEPLQLELIGLASQEQRFDRSVQVAMFFTQPLQLNRQGCALFLAHFAMRHTAFGPNRARQNERLLGRLCKPAPDRASARRTRRCAGRGHGHEALTMVARFGSDLNAKPAFRACKDWALCHNLFVNEPREPANVPRIASD
jgi:hypothetical protein